MELYLKITAGLLLLLVQAFHLASLQDSTDTPGRTIDKSWLRELAKKPAGSQNAAATTAEKENDYGDEASTMGSSFDPNNVTSGFMALNTEVNVNVTSQDKGANETSDDPSTMLPNKPEMPDTTFSPTTTHPIDPSQINMTKAKEDFQNLTTTPQNLTTHLRVENSTSFPDYFNHTDLPTTTVAAESNTTQESITKSDKDMGLTNETESTNTTTMTNITTTSTTMTPEISETPTMSSSTVFLSETTESPATLNAPKKVNETDKSGTSGSSSERGLAADYNNSKRQGAWGAILGTAVAVTAVGLVAYIILKKKQQKGFSHRKLVEEYPADPVLRLDNSGPLDLTFGGLAYYNPALQGDDIQMTNFPERRQN
ncbi:mucin-15 [Micropterus salmoides]|uniref:mucin-15 n=1 Tax=Micropterus salmoides TaxID=27706 RepID=UPI0018ED19B2|nr:mucin-15 [Micropterus salmoides]